MFSEVRWFSAVNPVPRVGKKFALASRAEARD